MIGLKHEQPISQPSHRVGTGVLASLFEVVGIHDIQTVFRLEQFVAQLGNLGIWCSTNLFAGLFFLLALLIRLQRVEVLYALLVKRETRRKRAKEYNAAHVLR